MKKPLLILLPLLGAVFAGYYVWSLNLGGPPSAESTPTKPATSTEQTTTSEPTSPPELTHLDTYELDGGTHRPEILTYKDKLYVLVVYPDPAQGVQHQGFIFDASDPEQIDFENPEKQFPVSWITDEYGQGADHRVAIVNDELWVVVQSNIMDPTKNCMGGPSEPCTLSQHLIFSRFDLEGELIETTELANNLDFEEDTYPDMCVLTDGDNWLVSTGIDRGLKIRRIDESGVILETYEYETSTDGILGSIGNSLFWTPEGELLLFSSTIRDINVTRLNADFEVLDSIDFELPDEENTFPTGVAYREGFYYVGYSARESGEIGIEQNPLFPRLMILDENLTLVDVIEISNEAGTGHVHPSLVFVGDRLFYTWSKNENGRPQVLIEIFEF